MAGYSDQGLWFLIRGAGPIGSVVLIRGAGPIWSVVPDVWLMGLPWGCSHKPRALCGTRQPMCSHACTTGATQRFAVT